MSSSNVPPRAFLEAPADLTYVQGFDPSTGKEDYETKLFILAGSRYDNVKNYVIEGANVTTGDDALAHEFGFYHLLSAPDKQLLQDTFADIKKHCSDFSTSMNLFYSVTSSIVGFCDVMDDNISGPTGLKAQISLLSREDDGSGWDDAKRRACIRSADILGLLSAKAKERESECGELLDATVFFQGLSNVDYGKLSQCQDRIQHTDQPRRVGDILWPYRDAQDRLVQALMRLEFKGRWAIEGMQAMKTTFARLTSDFDDMANYFKSIDDGLRDDDPMIRGLVEVDFDSALEKWKELKSVAQAFQDVLGKQLPSPYAA